MLFWESISNPAPKLYECFAGVTPFASVITAVFVLKFEVVLTAGDAAETHDWTIIGAQAGASKKYAEAKELLELNKAIPSVVKTYTRGAAVSLDGQGVG